MKDVRGNCCHCGSQTQFAWVDLRTPNDSPIYVCVECMNKAKVGYYASPAYEKVGQATYSQLLKPKPE